MTETWNIRPIFSQDIISYVYITRRHDTIFFFNFPHYERTYGLSEERRNSSHLQQLNQQRLFFQDSYYYTDVVMWGKLKDNLSDNIPRNDDMNEDTPRICFHYHHNNLYVQ